MCKDKEACSEYGQASVGPTLALHWGVCGSVAGTVCAEAKAQTGKALASCPSAGGGRAVPSPSWGPSPGGDAREQGDRAAFQAGAAGLRLMHLDTGLEA